MIIKFDHISYVTDRKKKVEMLSALGDPLFKEENLMNIQNKEEFMKNKQKDHDLYFFQGDIPTELIFYDRVAGQSKVSIENNTINGHYSDLERAYSFLSRLFPQKVTRENIAIKCNMRGILDKKDYYLFLTYDPLLCKNKVTLDTEGYGEIALICKGKIGGNGITEEESLIVNGKRLRIAFAYEDSIDIIFELISYA